MRGNPEFVRKGEEYCRREGLVFIKSLGFGVHGSVWAAKSQAKGGQIAIKLFEREADYRRERDVYFRLKDLEVTAIRGCSVPQLLNYDDHLYIIAMSVVTRPFVLDFAGAYLDRPLDFSEEVMADWLAWKREQFGPDWPEAAAIVRELEGMGIFLEDVSPSNISVRR